MPVTSAQRVGTARSSPRRSTLLFTGLAVVAISAVDRRAARPPSSCSLLAGVARRSPTGRTGALVAQQRDDRAAVRPSSRTSARSTLDWRTEPAPSLEQVRVLLHAERLDLAVPTATGWRHLVASGGRAAAVRPADVPRRARRAGRRDRHAAPCAAAAAAATATAWRRRCSATSGLRRHPDRHPPAGRRPRLRHAATCGCSRPSAPSCPPPSSAAGCSPTSSAPPPPTR